MIRPVAAALTALLLTLVALPAARAQTDQSAWTDTVTAAARLDRLRSLIVAQDGRPIVAEVFDGPGLDTPVNVKSVAKSVISTLIGMAIDRGLLEGVDQPVAELLPDSLPDNPDPRLRLVTVEHLLAMRAGLERTSGPNYGRWVASPDWVRFVLSRPFVDEPGGTMLYSTGNSHLLSAILTRVSGSSTLALGREWLGRPLGIEIPAWDRDPQGIYLGGNNMALSPRALLRLGELYRNGGIVDGRRVLSEDWIQRSWTPQTSSPFTGHDYGYGWFITEMRGHPVYYSWGYGGQMLYVVPDLALTVVMTSDGSGPSGRTGYVRELHRLLADRIMPPAESAISSDPVN